MMKDLLQQYVEMVVFRKDISSSQFERLINTELIVNSFWSVDAELNFKGPEKQKLVHSLELYCSLVESFLLPAVLEEYLGYFQNL